MSQQPALTNAYGYTVNAQVMRKLFPGNFNHYPGLYKSVTGMVLV